MSAENARKMIEAIQQDEALQNQITSGTSNSESAFNLTVELGKQQGLDFTAEEFQRELESLGVSVNADGQLESLSETVGVEGELTDEALETIAGGYNLRFTRCPLNW